MPEQQITVDEALRAYTTGFGWAEFQDGQKGQLAPGQLADLVVLSEDLFSMPPERIRDLTVRLTMVGGKIACGAC